MDPIFTLLGTKPMIRHICTKANTSQIKLFPRRSRNLCIKAQIHGQCDKLCNYEHTRVSDEEAEVALKELKKVIDKPNILKVNY